ncbi:hypothetical protein L210DRAFT_3508687 [Boletus edulis BED1]|uniref:Uncharacterized protein n=1 Tax=Boletus edulis BED1 TaxID=1328754 RepID=A0AAD4G8L5_BOLED|nr:hypothetical protein L210DRAFT_3508687 [Boletus edulis BED1]
MTMFAVVDGVEVNPIHQHAQGRRLSIKQLLQEGQPFFSKVRRRAAKRTNLTRLITVVNLLASSASNPNLDTSLSAAPLCDNLPQLQGSQDIKKPQAAFRRYPPRIPNHLSETFRCPIPSAEFSPISAADASVNNDGSLRYWYRMGTGTGRFLSPTVDV